MSIRLGFIVDRTDYIGGVNYLSNLLAALACVDDKTLIPYIFIGTHADQSIKNKFLEYATVIEVNCLNRGTVSWYAYKILYKLFGVLPQINKILTRYRIDVLSHSDICASKLPYKTINWLPDFQFLVMPKMFSWFERYRRNRLYERSIKYSDLLLVSSQDAKGHLNQFYGANSYDCVVLSFVANLPKDYFILRSDDELLELNTLYEIGLKYFYCPNQFWRHKNHLTLLEAVNLLKNGGHEIKIVFSGSPYDFRHPKYFEEINRYIEQFKLQEHVKFLGVIPHKHVLKLIRNSIAVINPSYFEGWSTTVEEAKSIGKTVILSNLQVHKEQAPEASFFFSPDNPVELADVLREFWIGSSGGPDLNLEKVAGQIFHSRQLEFGRLFARSIKSLYGVTIK